MLESGRKYSVWIGPSARGRPSKQFPSEAQALRFVGSPLATPAAGARRSRVSAASGGSGAGKRTIRAAGGGVVHIANPRGKRQRCARAKSYEDGDVEAATRSASGTAVAHATNNTPKIGVWPAGPELPNWTKHWEQAENGLGFWVYYNPDGVAIGNWNDALISTGQRLLSRSETRKVIDDKRRREEWERLLRRTVDLPETLRRDFEVRSKAHGHWKPRWKSLTRAAVATPVAAPVEPDAPDGPDATVAAVATDATDATVATDATDATVATVAPSVSGWAKGEYARFVYDRLVVKPLTDLERPSVAARVAVLDLFSGIGGWSLGLRSAGFGGRFGVDVDGRSIDTYRANKCGTRSIELRLQNDDVDSWVRALEEAGLCGENRVAELVIVASPPCQPYSVQGARRGGTDERDGMPFVANLIARVKPIMYAVENVPGMLSQEHTEHIGPLLERMQEGYVSRIARHELSLHGVPQKRERLILSGVRDVGSKAGKIVLHRCTGGEAGLKPPPTTMDAIAEESVWKGVRPNELRVQCNTIRARLERMQDTSQTTGLVSPYTQAPTVLTTSLSANVYQRLLALPIDVDPNKVTYAHLRALEVRHVLALQSFPSGPNGFVLCGGRQDQARFVGNAMPPMFAADVGVGMVRRLKRMEQQVPLLTSATPQVVLKCLEKLKASISAKHTPMPRPPRPSKRRAPELTPPDAPDAPDAPDPDAEQYVLDGAPQPEREAGADVA